MLIDIKTLFEKFKNDNLFENFYFIDGTALAYYLNHRISYDIDFISKIPLNPNALKTLSIKYDANFIPDINESKFRINTGEDLNNYKMMFNFEGIKVEFFYPNDNIRLEIIKKYEHKTIFDNIKILPLSALSELKLVALFQRNKIRDIFDIYFLFYKNILDLQTIEKFCSLFCNQTLIEFIEDFKDDGSESLDFEKGQEFYDILHDNLNKLDFIKDSFIKKILLKSDSK